MLELIGYNSRDLLHCKSISPAAAEIAGYAAIDHCLECLHLRLAVTDNVNYNVGAAVFNACAAVFQSFP